MTPRGRSVASRRWPRLARVVAAAAAVVTLSGLSPSAALAEQVRDPDDVAGRLDYRKLAATKRRRKDNAIVTMVFQRGFRTRTLRKPNGLVVWIDVDVDGREEFKGAIHDSRGGLLIHLDRVGRSDRFNPLPVFRLAPDTYRIVLPSGQPYNSPGRKAYYATSAYCSTTCIRDRVPDAGWLTT
jgi:hypothetical protein